MKNRQGTVFDVARYVLEKSGRMGTWKLQRLCYYSQAWHLAWTGRPVFGQEFQAWAVGPVCPELFQLLKGAFVVSAEELGAGDTSSLTEDEKDSIDRVLEAYGDMPPWELGELVRSEGPWRETRGDIPEDAGCQKTIPKTWMGEYYGR